MTPFRLLSIIVCFLLASVPWFYGGGSGLNDEGLPDWALHSFVVMILFSIFLVYALHKYWDSMADVEAEEEDSTIN